MAPDREPAFHIELDTKNYECSASEIARMERALDTLAEAVRPFPVSDLYVTVLRHSRTQGFHVKTSLILTGRTLFTGTRHSDMYHAYERCIDKLLKKVSAYKSNMEGEAERSKHAQGTHQEVLPDQVPDVQAIQSAIDNGSYHEFRQATLMYEEPVRKRIGRWVQRYPELNALIGNGLEISDLVEGVFLTAFESYEGRPQNVTPGDWFDGLIDREIHDLADDPEGELENIRLAQAAREAEAG